MHRRVINRVVVGVFCSHWLEQCSIASGSASTGIVAISPASEVNFSCPPENRVAGTAICPPPIHPPCLRAVVGIRHLRGLQPFSHPLLLWPLSPYCHRRRRRVFPHCFASLTSYSPREFPPSPSHSSLARGAPSRGRDRLPARPSARPSLLRSINRPDIESSPSTTRQLPQPFRPSLRPRV